MAQHQARGDLGAELLQGRDTVEDILATFFDREQAAALPLLRQRRRQTGGRANLGGNRHSRRFRKPGQFARAERL